MALPADLQQLATQWMHLDSSSAREEIAELVAREEVAELQDRLAQPLQFGEPGCLVPLLHAQCPLR